VQGLRGIRDPAATVNHQEGIEGIAIHVQTMQTTDDIRKNNKFV
jgi:hypothetical protein